MPEAARNSQLAAAARVAVVTGGAQGIGLSIARALLAAGWKVGILARNVERHGSVAAELTPDAPLVECDVAEETQVASAFGRCATRSAR